MARDLLARAADLGVEPWGVSFHVGSQQKDPAAWEAALAEAAGLFRDLEAVGIELGMVNLGGGFPTPYRTDVPDAAAYGCAIMAAVRRHFGNRLPFLIAEPGRGLVGNAGVIQTEVVLIAAARATATAAAGSISTSASSAAWPRPWTRRSSIRSVSHRTGAPEPVILAGPTCDSADVLYERAAYRLPLDLEIGDRLEIGATGAYTTTYAAVGFNGFAPLAEHYV